MKNMATMNFDYNSKDSKFKYLICILFICFTFSSCVKNDDLYTAEEGLSYMPQAYQDKGILSLLKVDSAQEKTFGFYYTSFNGAPNDITGTFEVDNSLIADYNTAHAYTGNIYHPLPKESYSLSSTTTIVKKGKTSSEPLSIIINPKYLTIGTLYMIPIKLVSVSSGSIDSTLSVTYFKIEELTIRSNDFTSEGTITASHLNTPAAENLPKLVDNNFSSKYLAFNYTPDLYIQLAFPSAKKLDAYTITSGNDAPERDPKNWTLQGSNDGKNWTTIDTRSNENFTGRRQTRTFNLQSQANYSYYRWNISSINGANLIQITEWRLLEYY